MEASAMLRLPMNADPQDRSAILSELVAVARHLEELADKLAAFTEWNWSEADEVARLESAAAHARRGAGLIELLVRELLGIDDAQVWAASLRQEPTGDNPAPH